MRDPDARAAVDGAFVRDLRLLFEASPDVLLVLLPDAPKFTMVAATNARLAATHTTREQTIGRSLFDLFPDNPDDPGATGASNLRASLERVIATRAPDTMAVQRYDIRDADGTFQAKYWSPKNIPVLSPSGEILYILHRVEDVTGLVEATELGAELRDKTRAMEREVVRRSQELATANAELRRANAKLGELDAAKTAFYSNVSHEFRTPLTLMLGPIEDALASPGRTLGGEALRLTHRNTLRLMRLVNSLLDFSQIEAGRMQASYQPTDVSLLTAAVAGAFRSAVERVGIRFVVECAPLPEPVFIDHDLWEKVVLNLLSNALKFTFEGEITVSAGWRDDHVEIVIRDTGTGIPEHELPHVFERFHRVVGARSRTHEGSGIGLALVHDLVRLHGGTVQVSSREGVGTTFTICLPRGSAHLPKERVAVPRATSASPGGKAAPHFVEEARRWSSGSPPTEPEQVTTPTAQSASKAPARILVVDDNADLRDYIAGILSPSYVVELATDGLAALDAVRQRRPALILSDVMMPNLDGFGLLRALRADPSLQDIPLILLSARAGEEATIEGLEAGADDYLVKPFAARELLARVRTHVELARQRAVLERFFTLSLDLMCIASAEGRFERVSPAFDLLGYGSEELLSRSFMDFVHQDDAATTQAELEKLAAGRRSLRFDNRYRCKDGSHRWLAWSAASEHGTVYAVARDVTEIRQAQEALARARDAAEAANRELEAFSYSVAHDLRAPLRSIDGFSQALLEDYAPKLDDEGRQYLSFVRESAQHMAQLIEDLLALSMVTRSELRDDEVNLSELARTAIARLQRSHPNRRVDVVIQDGVVSHGDARLLAVLFDNLLGNAWKFTGKRDGARIEFGAAVGGGHPVYFVRDDGAGFDAAFASRLFGVFQRLHSAAEFEGTGIGLATVRRIVSRHGGRVWAEGAVDVGASFYFTLHEQDRRE